MSDASQPQPVDISSPGSWRILHETVLTFAQAARRLPPVRGDKPPDPNTVARWTTKGRKSRSGRIVRLEKCRVGGTNVTSLEALSRFFDRLDDLDPPEPPRSLAQTDAALEKQADDAKRILRARGLIE